MQNTDERIRDLEADIAALPNVLIGAALKRYVDPIRTLQHRDCFPVLEDYLARGYTGKVFILYGLRRTGKTTLIRQAIASLSPSEFSRTAFIQVNPGDTLGDINADLKWLSESWSSGSGL